MIIYFRYIAFCMHILLIIQGFVMKKPEFILISISILLLNNIFWALEDFYKRFTFFFFQLVFFVFILGRPTYSILTGNRWFFGGYNELKFVLFATWLTLITLFAGAVFFSEYFKRKNIIGTNYKINSEFDKKYLYLLEKIIFICFIFSWVFNIYSGIERIVFSTNHSYSQYFVSFSSNMPYITRLISASMPFLLCIYLALRPNKKKSFIVLLMYLISNLPYMIVGTRNPIVLAGMFFVSYYLLRNNFEKGKWIGKKEKLVFFISIPATMIFMFSYAYIRSGLNVPTISFFSLLAFIYQQGTTFDVLSMGYRCLPSLPNNHNYVFGGIIDYYKHGTIAQKYFNAIPLDSSNSHQMGLISNSFAHNMSYIMHPGYLNGNGWGTSYILEVYSDFGYIGLFVFSFLLAGILIGLIHFFNKNIYLSVIILYILMNIFFMPRDSALSCVNQLFQLVFLAVIAFFIFLNLVVKKILKTKGV